MFLGKVFKFVFFGVLAVILSACGNNAEKEATFEIRPVRYQEVATISSVQQRAFSGIAQAGSESKLSFKVDGTIIEINPVVGSKLSKGQVLAELAATDYLIKVQEAEASLERAKAEARNAKANYTRVRQLYENRNASLTELDSARAVFESSAAAVRSIEKQLEFARLQASYTKIIAPGDCQVAQINAEENENVQAGQTVLTINCGEKPKVKVTVPEAYIAEITAGSAVQVRFDALPESLFSATVTEVGIAAGDIAAAFPVVVQLDNENSFIRSGMAGEVIFKVGGNRDIDRIVLPPAAVSEDSQGKFVFIITNIENAIGIVERRKVTIGSISNQGLEIVSGLTIGQLVVTAGVNRLRTGDKVKLPTKTTQQSKELDSEYH